MEELSVGHKIRAGDYVVRKIGYRGGLWDNVCQGYGIDPNSVFTVISCYEGDLFLLPTNTKTTHLAFRKNPWYEEFFTKTPLIEDLNEYL
jgi:hypothetical protein